MGKRISLRFSWRLQKVLIAANTDFGKGLLLTLNPQTHEGGRRRRADAGWRLRTGSGFSPIFQPGHEWTGNRCWTDAGTTNSPIFLLYAAVPLAISDIPSTLLGHIGLLLLLFHLFLKKPLWLEWNFCRSKLNTDSCRRFVYLYLCISV